VAGRDSRAAGATWRAARRFLAVQARIVPMADLAADTASAAAAAAVSDARVRFGFTVGKRYARRAVERAAVKRVLREAARQAAPALDAAAGPRAVDVVLRLRAPCPAKPQSARPLFKRQLRAEADALLVQLAAALRGSMPEGGAA
jgi:ribonuclease P protein component